MLTATNPAPLQPGQMVDGWRVVRLLGSGTFGAVYLVEKDGQHFAMKIAMHRASSGDAERADERLMREHRDLKLSNILVRASDGEPFVLDFSAGTTRSLPS